MKRLDAMEKCRIALDFAVRDVDEAVMAAERRLRLALAGLSLRRWRALVSGQASIRSAAAGRDANLAARRRSAVEAALQELSATRRASAHRVAEASTALDQAEMALAAFGIPASRGTAHRDPPHATPDRQKALRLRASSKEILVVSTRSNVKAYQRRLVELDAEHTRAQERLASARRRRDEVLAAQDRQVREAERELDKTVVAMAEEFGPELTANLLDIEVSEVKQLVRRAKKPSVETPAPASPTNPPRESAVG